jgi:hypothetical protein
VQGCGDSSSTYSHEGSFPQHGGFRVISQSPRAPSSMPSDHSVQLFGHIARKQSGPLNPASQSQMPPNLQDPCPEHPPGQWSILQSSPFQPWAQVHDP